MNYAKRPPTVNEHTQAQSVVYNILQREPVLNNLVEMAIYIHNKSNPVKLII